MSTLLTERAAAPRATHVAPLRFLGGVGLSTVAYVLGMMVAGGIGGALGVKLPESPRPVEPGTQLALLLVGGGLVALALALLAQGLGGRWPARWAALALLSYVAYGANTAIEASLFTRMGGMAGVALVFILPCALCAAVAAWLAGRPGGPGAPAAAGRSAVQWGWRLAAAWLSFPAIYFTFGFTLVTLAPWVREAYERGEYALVLPGLGATLAVQCLRGGLFLAAALPVLLLWQGSRRALVVRLTFALWVLVGLTGMVQASWLPVPLRLVHSVEILADSLVHALALAFLVFRERAAPPETRTAG